MNLKEEAFWYVGLCYKVVGGSYNFCIKGMLLVVIPV